MYYISQPVPPKDWERFKNLLEKGSIAAAFGLLDAELAIANGERDVANAQEKLAIAYLFTKDYPSALSAYTRAIIAMNKNGPILRRLFLGQGFVHQFVGEHRQALESYGIGIEKAIDQAFLLIKERSAEKLIKNAWADGKKVLLFSKEVFVGIKNYCSLDPIFAATRNNMGICFAELGDKETARAMFKEAIEFIPEGMRFTTPEKNLKILDLSPPI